MEAHIHTEAKADIDHIHPLSSHRVVQALLAAGPDKTWWSHEAAELLGITPRAVNLLCQAGHLGWTHYPTRNLATHSHPRRQISTHSLLIYVLTHSSEIDRDTVLAAWSLCISRLTTGTLRAMAAALDKVITARGSSSQPVVVIPPQNAPDRAAPRSPTKAPSAQLHLF